MAVSRRPWLGGATAAAARTAAALFASRRDGALALSDADDVAAAESMPAAPIVRRVGTMPCRRFGRTGLEVSAVGLGSWPIGGQAYGAVSCDESLRAPARAEELGCNFIDTAMVSGDAETLLGEFMAGRRERWIVATRYSGQPEGLVATLETQLRRLRTDRIDFYQLPPGALVRIAGVQRELWLPDTAGSRWRRRLSRVFGR